MKDMQEVKVKYKKEESKLNGAENWIKNFDLIIPEYPSSLKPNRQRGI